MAISKPVMDAKPKKAPCQNCNPNIFLQGKPYSATVRPSNRPMIQLAKRKMKKSISSKTRNKVVSSARGSNRATASLLPREAITIARKMSSQHGVPWGRKAHGA